MRESDIQSAIMDMLSFHPKVAWATVTTSGKVKAKGYWISLGFPGLSDIIGQMHTGAFLALEVKRPGQIPTPIQAEFLETVRRFGGISGWCTDIEGALEILK